MLSLPDPHGPNTVREPYASKYKDLTFKEPKTMFKTDEQNPGWSPFQGNNYIKDRKLNQGQMAAYFGMVECIDDNMGRLANELKRLNLEDNTIVVFTSDHGDLMGEHRKHNKGIPFEASAKVAFLWKQPGIVPAGKVIHSAMTSVDFGPTLFSLMGIEGDGFVAQGRDLSDHFQNSKMNIQDEEIIYIRGTTMHPSWVAAVSDSYKLVISDKDKPWLFDLKKDPDELINFYEKFDYRKVRERFTKEIARLMAEAKEPALGIEEFRKWLF